MPRKRRRQLSVYRGVAALTRIKALAHDLSREIERLSSVGGVGAGALASTIERDAAKGIRALRRP